MAELVEELTLDISPALAAIDDIDSALTAAVEAFGGELQAALETIDVAPVEQSLASVDTTSVTQSLEESAAAGGVAVTESIEQGAAAAEAQVIVDDVDASAVTEAIEEAAGAADVGALPEVGAQAREAGGGLDEFSGSALQARGAAGLLGDKAEETSGKLTGVATKAGPAAAAIAGAAAGYAAFVAPAIEAADAQTRFTRTFGPLGDQIQDVDIGGLSTDLESLAIQTGSSDDALQISLSNLGNYGQAAGLTKGEVAGLSEEFLVLSNFVAATRPELGGAEEVTTKLIPALTGSARAARTLGLPLSAAEVAARALKDTGKATADELSDVDKVTAGLAITFEKLGPQIKTGITEGSKTGTVAIRSLRVQVGELAEELGAPFVDPAVGGLNSLRSIVGLLRADLPGLNLNLVQTVSLGTQIGQLGRLSGGVSEFFGALDEGGVTTQETVEIMSRLPGAAGESARALLAEQTAVKASTAAKQDDAQATSDYILGLSNIGITLEFLGDRTFNLETLATASQTMSAAFTSSVPTASASLAQFASDTEININKVIEQLTKQTSAFVEFMPNLKSIIDKGGADLALTIQEMGPEQGAAFAAAVASATPAQIAALEQQTDRRNTLIAGSGAASGSLLAGAIAGGATTAPALSGVFEAGKKAAGEGVKGAAAGGKGAEQAGKDVGEGFARGVESKSEKARGAGFSIGKQIKVGLERVFGLFSSPPPLSLAMGGDVGEGFALGILDTRRQVERAAQSLARSALINPSTALRAIPVGAAQSAQSTQPSAPIVAGGTTVKELHVHEAPDPRATIFRIDTELSREANRG